MQSMTKKRVLAAVLSGCMIATNAPAEISAAEVSEEGTGTLTAEFSDAVLNHESVLTVTTSSDVNGQKEVQISDYIPKQEYVQDGLVMWLDGIDNVGKGTHDNQSEYWVDLTDNTQIKINRDGKDASEGTNTFTDTAFQLNASKVYLPDKIAKAVNGDNYTVEFVVDSEGYSGNSQTYSPLLTVDEAADSWSIFTRTKGSVMELKQGANSVRLQSSFSNVFNTTSAIAFQKNQESAWYANGQKKSSFTSEYNAEAENVILGGRVKGSDGTVSKSYMTSASYHAIRVYDRTLTKKELRQNAAYDLVRYYGADEFVPDIKINGTELSKEGTTTVTAEFKNGVATIPVDSDQVGIYSMDVTVDGATCEAEIETGEAMDLAMEAVPSSIELTDVSSTSTPSVIRKVLKEKLDEQLKDTVFVQDGGSISVSGDQNSFSVKFTLGETTKTKTVTATFAIEGYDADIYEPTTGLVMSPSVVSENDGKTVSELVSGTRRPSSIIRTVSENLTVTDANQEISIAEYVNRVNKKALVGFRIDSMTVAKAFAAYAKENNLVDVMVISSDPEILLAACNRLAGLHGMLDCGAYATDSNVDLFDLISKTNEANARILVLPQELATEENIAYVQARAISTWVRTDKSQVTDVILNGADGILVDDSENAYNVIESFEAGTPVLTRNTVITAHRGFHETAPENSERAAKLAVEAGADTIECDIYLSKDGEVVVNHDDTTGRLMNKDLDVSESTLAELQELTFNENAQEGDKLPTLKELFIAADEADPDDDVIHVIEIKTKDPAVIDPMVKVIKEMNMEKRVVFISFYDYQLELVRKAMPNVAVGELNGVVSKTDDASTALKKLCYRMDEYGYFYNCSYGAQNTDILKAARFRGIYVHPWTVNAQDTFEDEYINNYHGITTNRTDHATNYLSEVTTGKDTYTLTAKEKGVKIDAKAYTRAGDELKDATITMKQVSGTAITWDPATKTCTAEKAGEATVIFGTTYKLTAIDKTYTVYSAPVTIKVENLVPSSTMTVDNKLKKVSEVSLPTGWVWSAADADKELSAGGKVEATAEYTGTDKAEYTTTTQKVTIKRDTCESGKILYTGEGEHAPECGEQGLGHKECIHCGAVLETGIVVGTSGKHTWDEGVVTKEATTTENGEKTYNCTNCKKTKTEEIATLGAPKKNTVLTDKKSKAKYKVTVAGSKNGTVEYVKSTSKTAKTVTIPEKITVDGITYKVTSIAQSAFKNNKTITKVTIPANVAKIGKKAFYGCKNLKTITIKTTKLTAAKVGSNAFKGIQKKATIKVPKAKLDAYKKILKKKGIGADVKVKGM